VFQRFALFAHRSVEHNIGFALEIAGMAPRERRRRVEEMLDLVQLPGTEHRSVSTLSGGEAQRVALARALIGRPEVLLLDEPLAALDLKLRKAMQLELRRIHEELGTTFLYVTHDQEEALTMSDTIVLMNNGSIVQRGTPEEVYRDPATIFASRFVGESNLLAGKVEMVTGDATTIVLDNGHRVVSSSGRSSVGDAVVVSVRPEQVVVTDASPIALDNHLVGVVRRRIFLGNVVRLIVTVDGGVTMTAELAHSSDGGFDAGAQVGVGWDRSDGLVLADTIETGRDDVPGSGTPGSRLWSRARSRRSGQPRADH
jgi:ABC-type Fe3+/spermidine/putrescine transport system ATPase subunit